MTFDRAWLCAVTLLAISSTPQTPGFQGAIWVIASLVCVAFLALAMWRWTQSK